MYYLFFDTETTGLNPLNDRLLSIGMVLTDERGKVLMQHYFLIKPTGFTINETSEAFRINQISNNMVNEDGKNIFFVMTVIDQILNKYKPLTLVAHNIEFDLAFMISECDRIHLHALVRKLQRTNLFCTAKIVDPGGYTSLKNTYLHFFGKENDGHHNALADAIACKNIFFQYENFKQLS